MKRAFALVSGMLALTLALAPAAFAATASVTQVGIQVVEDETVTTDDGETVETDAEVTGVNSEVLEVFITGSTDTAASTTAAGTTAVVSEAQQEANRALAEANTTGNTVQSMIDTNQEIEQVLTSAGVTAANTVVSTECYIGVQHVETGTVYQQAKVNTAVVQLTSTDEVEAIVAVLRYDSASGQWVPVPFKKAGNKLVVQSGEAGAYRFVSKVG